MSNHNSRLAKLETKHAPAVKQYICMYYKGQEAAGFDVTDSDGRNSQHFATRAELDAFDSRPDVDLLVIVIKYASETQPVSTFKQGDYSFTVGVDASQI